MYQELVEYHQAHGDCNVPRDYSENPQLATWVGGQRQRNNRGNLDAEKIEKLDELGFSWNPDQDFWDKMYDALVEYKENMDIVMCHKNTHQIPNLLLGSVLKGDQ